MRRYSIPVMMLIIFILSCSQVKAQPLVTVPDDDSRSSGLIRRGSEPLFIDVWTDRDEGQGYYPGERVKIFFRANRDCYAAIYDIDTRGYIHLLYPRDYNDRHFIRGGVTYRIPDYNDDYSLYVDGPEGIEYIQAVASYDRFRVPRIPSYYLYDDDYDDDYYEDWRVEGDIDVYLSHLPHRIIPIEDNPEGCAVALYSFPVYPDYPRSWPHRTSYFPPYYYPPYYGDWGFIFIDYPIGAEVFIDGIFYGWAPLYIPRITVGLHIISVRYDHIHYYGWEKPIRIVANKTIRFRADTYKDWKRTKILYEKPKFVSRSEIKYKGPVWHLKDFKSNAMVKEPKRDFKEFKFRENPGKGQQREKKKSDWNTGARENKFSRSESESQPRARKDKQRLFGNGYDRNMKSEEPKRDYRSQARSEAGQEKPRIEKFESRSNNNQSEFKTAGHSDSKGVYSGRFEKRNDINSYRSEVPSKSRQESSGKFDKNQGKEKSKKRD